MKTRNRISRIRRIIGDILLVLVILLIVDVAFDASQNQRRCSESRLSESFYV